MSETKVSVGAFILNKGEMLLIESLKWGNRYVVPSGKVKFMESVEDAVHREVKEETQLDIHNLKFFTYLEFVNSEEYYKKNVHTVSLQYLCESFNRDVVLNDESSNYIWVSPLKARGLYVESMTYNALELLTDQGVRNTRWALCI